MTNGSWRRRRFPRSTTSVLVLLLLFLGLGPLGTAAGQEASPAASPPGSAGTGGTLTGGFDVGPGGAPEVFNPLLATAGFTWLALYYSKLLVYDADFTAIQGELAESFEVSADGLTYTIRLRDGVTWHDGQPFTSEDVRFTLDLVKNPDSGSLYAVKFATVAAVDTPDPLTAVLTLSEPNAALPDALSFLVMLPEHALASFAPAELVQGEWWSTTPIGTGPFRWGEYRPGEYVELVAYDGYWKGRPRLDRVINRYFEEPGAAVIALRAREIDFTYVGADDAQALGPEAGLRVLQGPSQVANYLGFNLRDPRFGDVRVRQAFMHAVDRQAIIDQLYGGGATAIPCVYSNPDYQPAEVEPYAPDPERARQLLADAGWDQSAGPIEIVTYYNDQLSSDVLVIIQQMLADVGIDVTLRTVDTPTFNQIMGTADWDMIYAGQGNGPDPDTTYGNFVSTATPPNGFNRTYIDIPELDTLYGDGRRTIDPAARPAVYQRICGVLNAQVPWAFLWVADRFGAVSDRAQNFVWVPAPGGGRYDQRAHEWAVAP